jgi:hypothetical protein
MTFCLFWSSHRYFSLKTAPLILALQVPRALIAESYAMNKQMVKVMAKITFVGFVSDQKEAGVIVTITVTLPSGDTMHVAAATLEDKTYSVVQEFIIEGDYSAVANVETGLATSDVVCFTVTKALTESIVTLNVRRTVRNRKGKVKTERKTRKPLAHAKSS